MAKKKKKNDEDAFYKALLGDTDGQVLSDVGKVNYFIDTGNLAINYICSGRFITGGIPGGKITEVFGPPAAAKSLLGYTVLGSNQRMGGVSVMLDCERAANPEFAERAGHVDPNRLVTFEPVSIEAVEKKIIAVLKKVREHKDPDVPILFVWDSIGVTPTEREWSETELPETYTKEQFKQIVGSLEKPGERARAAGDALRKLNPLLNENNATMFVINQTRSAIGVGPYNEVTAGGGKALPFFASCRLRTSPSTQIKDTKLKLVLGVNMRVQNKKNRCHAPFGATENIHLYFESGISPLGGLLTVMLGARRVEAYGKGNGNYQVVDPWADGKTIKFKASQDANQIPTEVLLDCPALIDAKSVEEVKNYLATYGEAIELEQSDTTEEEGVEQSALDKLGLSG